LSPLKEPHYFAFDLNTRRAVETASDYARLFRYAKPGQMRGEASVLYLWSETAIGHILRHRPDTKLIAMVRNPIEVFVSWHRVCLNVKNEDQERPEVAWQLQEHRRQGRRIPIQCHAPFNLRYREIVSFGAQIERLFGLVPKSQRLVLLYDDICQKPEKVMAAVRSFLGLQEDSQLIQFPGENGFWKPRNEFVAWMSRTGQTNRMLKRLRVRVKPWLNTHGIDWIEQFYRRNKQGVAKPELPAAFHRQLSKELGDDLALLGQLLGRDLSHWLSASANQPPDQRPAAIAR
jgi:hypothetical protein